MVSKVTVIHRRDKLRAQKILQQKALDNLKIKFLWNHVVVDVVGKDKVEAVHVKNVKTSETSELKCDGVFVAIGHEPNTDIFPGQLEIDEKGYVIRKTRSMTSVEGVFAAGDVHDYMYRQVATAVGSGCEAALDTIRWLEAQQR